MHGAAEEPQVVTCLSKTNTSVLDYYILYLLFPTGANFYTVHFLCRRWKPQTLLWQDEDSAVLRGEAAPNLGPSRQNVNENWNFHFQTEIKAKCTLVASTSLYEHGLLSWIMILMSSEEVYSKINSVPCLEKSLETNSSLMERTNTSEESRMQNLSSSSHQVGDARR